MKERKQTRTVSLTPTEAARFEVLSNGSLSGGVLEVLKRHDKQVVDITTLQARLRELQTPVTTKSVTEAINLINGIIPQIKK